MQKQPTVSDKILGQVSIPVVWHGSIVVLFIPVLLFGLGVNFLTGAIESPEFNSLIFGLGLIGLGSIAAAVAVPLFLSWKSVSLERSFLVVHRRFKREDSRIPLDSIFSVDVNYVSPAYVTVKCFDGSSIRFVTRGMFDLSEQTKFLIQLSEFNRSQRMPTDSIAIEKKPV